MAETTTRLPLLSRVAAVAIMVAGVLVLFGWAAGIQALLWALPPFADMNPLTALTFLVAGLCLCRLAGSQSTSSAVVGRDRLALGLALAVTLVGALKLSDYLFGLGLQIDRLPFVKGGASEMAPNTAFGFVMCGAALLLLDVETRRAFRPAQALALMAGFVGLLAVIGYSYRVPLLYRVGKALPMSLGGAICFMLLCGGLLAARPDRGLMHVITSRTTGGAMARRLLPMAILIPWVLGGVLLMGEQSGYYPRQFSVSIFAISSILIFTLLIAWNAKLLHLADLEHLRTARRLAAQHHSTRVLAEATSFSAAFPRLLRGICQALGWQAGFVWTLEPAAQVLRCTEFSWSGGRKEQQFSASCRAASVRQGEELPGRVWASLEPIWISDLAEDSNLPRSRLALQCGLRSECAIPIRAGETFFGVLEFFSATPERRDEELIEMFSSVGTQVELFIERTRAQEQLRQTSANLQRSNTDLQQFAYVASHDLFEPLRMITSYLQLLDQRCRDKLDGPAREFIESAVDGARRMDGLIRDLLAYSRVDARGRAFEPLECDQVLEAALSNLKVAIEESHAEIVHQPLPRIRGDSVQLTQVFQNLVSNAIKFRGERPPRVEIGAERREGEWCFQVKDNGIGIDPKFFERIFVLFQRLHTRQEYAGTGMGLAICKKIIERHGGRIWLESQPGSGSTFYFTLPAV